MKVLAQQIDRYGRSSVTAEVKKVKGTTLKSVLPKVLSMVSFFNEEIVWAEKEIKKIENKKKKTAEDIDDIEYLEDELKGIQREQQNIAKRCRFNKAGTVAHYSGEEVDYIFVNLDKVQ